MSFLSKEDYIGLGVVIVLVSWTITRYLSNIKGVYKFSLTGFWKELVNTFIFLGTKYVEYPEKDKIINTDK